MYRTWCTYFGRVQRRTTARLGHTESTTGNSTSKTRASTSSPAYAHHQRHAYHHHLHICTVGQQQQQQHTNYCKVEYTIVKTSVQIMCCDVTKFSIYVYRKYTPPCCRSSYVCYMYDTISNKIDVTSTVIRRRSNSLSLLKFKFRTQATNTSTTNYVNVAYDWLAHNMASASLISDHTE